jgi:inner membrane protein
METNRAPETVGTRGLFDSLRAFVKPFAVSIKLAGIITLLLLLQIPLSMIRSGLEERSERRDAAVREITAAWGHAQEIIGPVLVVPYQTTRTVEKETVVNGHSVRTSEDRLVEAYASFLPETLSVEGLVEPAVRYRGIYEAIVYTTRLKISGHFSAPNLKSLGLAPHTLQWQRAWISFGISDLRGTRDTVTLQWDGRPVRMLPGAELGGLEGGLHADLIATANTESPALSGHDFTLEIALNGSDRLLVAPLAVETSVKLDSPWADPSFTGAFLPSERTISPSGFTAAWKVPHYGRDLPQQWIDFDHASIAAEKVQASLFGVEFVKAVDSYRAVERAIKHGALFLTLVFTTFFLFEVLSSLRLHSLHYLLVGAALCLFYLGLLSLSEFFSFGNAYLVSASASTLFIGAYCRSVLRSGRRSAIIVALLGATYGFLYFVLHMQDYAFLAGTAALFVFLAAVMYATRNVEWSATSAGKS